MQDIMGYVQEYLKKLSKVFEEIEITGHDGTSLSLSDSYSLLLRRIKKVQETDNKLMFIGNGGSAAIASHQAIDFWKNGKVPATAFNDVSLLTCLSNDYGYEFVFEKPIEMFGKKDDILFAISSSGKSQNIINGVKAAKKNKCFVVTLSGFSSSNPLRSLGDINFYVPSPLYGHVEITHGTLLHMLLDAHMGVKI